MARFLLLLFLLLCPVAGQAQEHVSLYDKHLTATVPKGLFALTAKAISEEYPGKARPQYVYKNGKGDYSVAFNHLQKTLVPKDLLPFHAQLRQQLEAKMPGIQWVSNQTLILQNRTWGVLEFKAANQGEMLHNWILISSWKGRVLEILISAFDDVEGNVDAQVKEFLNTLRVTD